MLKDKSIPECLFALSSLVANNGGGSIQDRSSATLELRPVCPADEPLLYRIYSSTRTEELELTGWNDEMRETFLRLQYDAQRRSYLLQLPNAEYWIVQRKSEGVGRLIIDRTDDVIHVVDIALLPD